VGAVVATGAPVGTAVGTTIAACPHPSISPPFIVALTGPTACVTGSLATAAAVGATAGPTAGTVSSLASAAVVGTPVGTAVSTVSGHPPVGLLFLPTGVSTPTGPATGGARPLDAVLAVGIPTGAATGARWPLSHRSYCWSSCKHHCWCPRLVVLRPVHGRSPILVNVTHLLCGTPVWVSGVARLVVLLGTVHGWSPILVDVAHLLRGTLVWLSRVAGRTLVHSAFAIAVAALDAVVS
jgi:hypothetical protein